jgi:hypothetical protein
MTVLSIALGWINNANHNNADATRRKALRRGKFSTRFAARERHKSGHMESAKLCCPSHLAAELKLQH